MATHPGEGAGLAGGDDCGGGEPHAIKGMRLINENEGETAGEGRSALQRALHPSTEVALAVWQGRGLG